MMEDFESSRIWARGYVVREWCDEPSNFRCEKTLDQLLKEQGIPGIYGVDTRHLTKLLRKGGHPPGDHHHPDGAGRAGGPSPPAVPAGGGGPGGCRYGPGDCRISLRGGRRPQGGTAGLGGPPEPR